MDNLDLALDSERQRIDNYLKGNIEYREDFFSLVASAEAIAFVGAGLSAHPTLGYPDWKKLIKSLETMANSVTPVSEEAKAKTKDDPLAYAEALKRHLVDHEQGDQYYNFLGREFGPLGGSGNCTDTHISLVQLPFRTYITTNYDPCLNTPGPGMSPKVG